MADLTPLTTASEAKNEKEALTHGYILRVLLAFDMFCNVVLFHGRLDETISSHAGRSATEGHLWGRVMVKFLNIFQKNHSAQAEAGDLARAEAIAKTEAASPLLPEKEQ